MDKIHYDQKDGIGAVPWNQDVDYRGFRLWMSPDKFLECARRLAFPNDMTILFVAAALKYKRPIASPFLEGTWDKKNWNISGHEGRNRCIAIQQYSPGELVEVHFIPTSQGLRARDIDMTMIQSFAKGVKGESGNWVENPASIFQLRGEKIQI